MTLPPKAGCSKPTELTTRKFEFAKVIFFHSEIYIFAAKFIYGCVSHRFHREKHREPDESVIFVQSVYLICALCGNY